MAALRSKSTKLIQPSDRIFVAGHRGMVGSAICRALLRSGYGNSLAGGELLTANRDELDLRDETSVQNWFTHHQPTVVVLAAAKVGGIYANNSYPADFLLENLKIQTSVIETSWRSGVRRLLFLGSSCIYPKLAEQPIREESLLSGALEKTNEWYAIAKIAGIKLAQSLRNQYSFDAICLMPTNLYGPGDNYNPTASHVLPALIRRFYNAAQTNEPHVTCWGTGNPFREFMYVDDLAEACIFALEHWDPAAADAPCDALGQPLTFLNVGTGVDLTIRELSAIVAAATGFAGDILWDSSKPDGTPKKQLDITRLRTLGWTAKVSLEEGIQKTLCDYRKRFHEKTLRL